MINKFLKKLTKKMRKARKSKNKFLFGLIPAKMLKRFSVQFLVLALLTGLNWTGFWAIGTTVGFFNDTETSNENGFTAGYLDFYLEAEDWSPAEMAGTLVPGDTIMRAMSVLMSGGSMSFQYKIKTVKTSGDDAFCDALQLVAKRESIELYNDGLTSFDLTPSVEIGGDGQDDWTFEVKLPTGSGPFDEESCEFRFDVDGWQIEFPDGLSGFNDHEELENILESSVAETEDGLDNISPIADSYVDQDNEDNNYGTSDDLKVRSQSGEKNKRAFIRFDFNFPTGTSVLSSELKLFLDDAPSSTRTYAIDRSLSSWTETDITWDNQPATLGTPTASVITGTINDIWLSWDVTDDITDFVNGISSNYGWGVSDTVESSATSREGKFTSRNDDDEDERPVLEVAFSAPPATTTHLVVNEVYYDVGDGKGSEGTNEWAEIYNPIDVAVDISGWSLCDNTSCDVIPASTTPIPAYGFAVITNSASTWTKWTIPAGAVKIVLGSNIGGGLADSGDAVILKNSLSVEVDAMSYGSDTSKLSPSVSDGPEGTSVARIVKGYDADLATDWIINATPNPGTNPSGSGVEIMRFTDRGVEVADYADGLEPLSAPAIVNTVEPVSDPVSDGSTIWQSVPDIVEEISQFVSGENNESENSEENGVVGEEQNVIEEEVIIEDAAEEEVVVEEEVVEETLIEETIVEEVVVEESLISEEVVAIEEEAVVEENVNNEEVTPLP